MSSEPIISLKNISKSYWVYKHPAHRLLHRITGGLIGSRKEFKALQDVRLEIYRGETVGLIGCNGSGKSTLLQIISGIRKPSSGFIQVKGRVSALLELGSGFQPELTGRENIYLQAAVMGLSHQEVQANFDDIITFAEIDQEYLDQPVKNYSSGMFVRLAFAVAVSYRPEILIVDEALSVGDVFFQHKCIEKIQELQQRGTSLLLVSHDRSVILSTCRRAILLTKGKVILQGAPDEVMNYYETAATA
jgi:ABC-type polysaccharide/polyol phosphate transport system ATPase subunit